MCRSCGNFVTALPEDGRLWPQKEECPKCGGTEFKNNDNGETLNTQEE